MTPLSYFRVTLTEIDEPSPSNGFIDPKRVEMYRSETIEVASFDKSIEKERANIRWNEMIQTISQVIAPLTYIDIDSDATINTPPSTLSFTFIFDREEYLRVKDENNEGNYLTAENALKRLIARSFTRTLSKQVVVFDPSVNDGVKYGESTLDVDVGRLAETVTEAESSIEVERVQYTQF